MTTKVLFVDDEANVLAGLRRMLRSQRKTWEMKFAKGGAEALAMLQQENFDVIVSDMRMPGIDGAELLTQVSVLYPHTVRLVLSGQSEHEKIFRAIGPAHQFMSKPCDPEVLIDTVRRACGLHCQLHDDALQGVISKISTLPSLPSIYHDLVRELKSENACADRVGEIIGGDIAMTAKILQLVNSSFFGLPQHVTCPKHAVSMLGLSVIQPLVLSANAFAAYEDPHVPGFSLEGAIHHGLEVATLAREISHSVCQEGNVVDDAFIAGMLHDTGKLILAVNLEKQFSESIALAAQECIPLCKAEQAVIQTTHAEVGAYLLGLWGLPNPIVEAVAFHHRPGEAGSTEFSPLTAVHIANGVRRAPVCRSLCNTSPDFDHDYLEATSREGNLNRFLSMSTAEATL